MDSSQRTRLIQEAANLFVARTKTVDSSLLTMKIQQRTAYAGSARFNTPAYYQGAPIVNPILPSTYGDISGCKSEQSFTRGFASVTNTSQHEAIANERGGAAICGDADYSTAPQFIFLQNLSTCNTILTSYNNNVSYPSGPDGPPASAGLSASAWAAMFASSSGNSDSTSNSLLDLPRFVAPTSLPSMYFQGNAFIQLSQDTVYPTVNTSNISSANDFTIEFFVRPSGAGPTTQTIFYTGAPASATTYKMTGNLVVTATSSGLNTTYNFRLTVSTLGTFTVGELLANQWYHITVMRYGSFIYYFQNGTQMGFISLGAGIPSSSSPFTTNYLSGAESTTTIGGMYDAGFTALANGFNGYLTNFRWTKGLALYLLQLDGITRVPNRFTVPLPPLYVNSITGVYTPLEAYVAVGLLAQSAATLLTNTRSPTATVSVQNGSTINGAYTPVGWAIA